MKIVHNLEPWSHPFSVEIQFFPFVCESENNHSLNFIHFLLLQFYLLFVIGCYGEQLRQTLARPCLHKNTSQFGILLPKTHFLNIHNEHGRLHRTISFQRHERSIEVNGSDYHIKKVGVKSGSAATKAETKIIIPKHVSKAKKTREYQNTKKRQVTRNKNILRTKNHKTWRSYEYKTSVRAKETNRRNK